MSEFFFILGVSLVSVATGYAVWVPIRVARLRASIDKIKAQLTKSAEMLGETSNSQFIGMCGSLDWFNRVAPQISAFTVVYMAGSLQNAGFSPRQLRSGNAELDVAIETAKARLSDRVLCYFTDETIVGFSVWAIIRRMLPANFQAKQRATKVIRESVEPYSR